MMQTPFYTRLRDQEHFIEEKAKEEKKLKQELLWQKMAQVNQQLNKFSAKDMARIDQARASHEASLKQNKYDQEIAKKDALYRQKLEESRAHNKRILDARATMTKMGELMDRRNQFVQETQGPMAKKGAQVYCTLKLPEILGGYDQAYFRK